MDSGHSLGKSDCGHVLLTSGGVDLRWDDSVSLLFELRCCVGEEDLADTKTPGLFQLNTI